MACCVGDPLRKADAPFLPFPFPIFGVLDPPVSFGGGAVEEVVGL